MTLQRASRDVVVHWGRRAALYHKGWRDKETRRWRVEMFILAAGVVAGGVTLAFTVAQLNSVNKGLDSTAAAAVYQQQQDIDNIFVENDGLDAFFSEGDPVPADHKDRAKIKAVAFRLLDHFEHIEYQIEADLFEDNLDGWKAYISGSFADSPVLCETLVGNLAEYDTLWGEFASEPCTALGVRP